MLFCVLLELGFVLDVFILELCVVLDYGENFLLDLALLDLCDLFLDGLGGHGLLVFLDDADVLDV